MNNMKLNRISSLWLLSLVAVPCISFVPDESYGRPYRTSSYHTTITHTALKIALQNYLRTSSICLPGSNIPDPYASLLSTKEIYRLCFGPESTPSKFEKASKQIQSGNERVDKDGDTKDNPLYHFDAERILQTNQLLSNRRQSFWSILTSDGTDFSRARQAAGSILHTIQDFYSHTNWVENGNRGINNALATDNWENIGPVSGVDEATCIDCINSEEGIEARKRFAAIFSAIKGSTDNIFQCANDNLKVKGKLTSGYYPKQSINGEAVLKPPTGIKCSHGGVFDGTSTQPAIGGINKDSADAILSPHNHLHATAANLAVHATVAFLEKLRGQLSDLDQEDTYRRFFGIEYGPALAFVIDTTGSMGPYIRGAIARSKQIIDSLSETIDKPSHYILVPFNDPEYGPLYETTDPLVFKRQLGSLTAEGGGDIPEMCFHGIFLAAVAAEQGTKIFVFTDAPPKDYYMFNQILAIAQEKKLWITFELGGIRARISNTGFALPQADPLRTPYDFDDYFNLASSTGGMVITTSGSEEDIFKSSAIFDTVLSINTVLIYRKNTQIGSLPPFIIPVDNTMIGFSITITAAQQSSVSCIISDIRLINPDKNAFNTSNSKLTPSTYMVIVNGTDLVVGEWTLSINTTDSSCKYSVNVFGQSTAAISFAIAELFLDSAHPSFQEITGNPLAGQNSLLLIGTSDDSVNLTTVEFLLPADGTKLQSLPLTYSADGGYSYFVNLTIPTVSFQIQVVGTDMKKQIVIRQSENVVQPTDISLVAATDSENSSYSIRQGEELRIILNITNNGATNDFSFQATDNRNFVFSYTPKTVRLSNGESIEATIILRAPDTARPGTVTLLQMIATTISGSVNFVQLNIPVIAKEPDIYPPVCNILNSSYHSVCNGLDVMKSCDSKQWDAAMAFFDHGQGLYGATLKASGGVWNGTVEKFAPYLADKNVSAVIRGDCCVQNITLTVIDVVGQSGQCYMELVDTYPPQLTVDSSDFNTVCDKISSDKPACDKQQFSIKYAFMDYGQGLNATDILIKPSDQRYTFIQTPFFQNTARQTKNATLSGSCCIRSVTFTVFDMAQLSTSVSRQVPGAAISTVANAPKGFTIAMAFFVYAATQNIR